MRRWCLRILALGLLLAAGLPPASAEESMLVHVYLADGFANDRVVARVDGREVFAKDEVTTKLLTSLADSFTFTAVGAVRLEVVLPARSLAAAIAVDPGGGRYIAVSVEAGGLTHFVSDAPLGFH
jgi:hypothetical protein